MICKQLRPGHLSVNVEDGSWHMEEIVKKSRGASLNAIIIIIIIKSSHVRAGGEGIKRGFPWPGHAGDLEIGD